jgi:bloom syndrome protein
MLSVDLEALEQAQAVTQPAAVQPAPSTSRVARFTPHLPAQLTAEEEEELLLSVDLERVQAEEEARIRAQAAPNASSSSPSSSSSSSFGGGRVGTLDEIKDRLLSVMKELLDFGTLSTPKREALARERSALEQEQRRLENSGPSSLPFSTRNNNSSGNSGYSSASVEVVGTRSAPSPAFTASPSASYTSTVSAYAGQFASTSSSSSSSSSSFQPSSTSLASFSSASNCPSSPVVNQPDYSFVTLSSPPNPNAPMPRWREDTAQWDNDNFPWSSDAHAVNRTIFGHRGFRGHQRSIINATMSNADVLVLMPTGGGKSLCYQLPSVIEDKLTIVISPLIALMQDQVRELLQAGYVCVRE